MKVPTDVCHVTDVCRITEAAWHLIKYFSEESSAFATLGQHLNDFDDIIVAALYYK